MTQFILEDETPQTVRLNRDTDGYLCMLIKNDTLVYINEQAQTFCVDPFALKKYGLTLDTFK